MIARSFAFIFQRNMPNLGLLGFTMHDQEFFFEASTEGKENSVDFDTGTIRLDGCASFSR